MRYLFLIVFFGIYQNTTGAVKISGTIKGANITKVSLLLPINGFSNETVDVFSLSEGIKADSTFNIETTIDSTYFVKLLFDSYPIWLIIEPDDSINVYVDFSKNFPYDQSALKITGKNASGNLLINNLNNPPIKKFNFIYSILEQRKEIENTLSDFLDSTEVYLFPIKQLQKNEKITKEYLSIAESSFRGIFLSELIKKLMQSKFYSMSVSSYKLINYADEYLQSVGGIYGSLIKRSYLNRVVYSLYFQLKAISANSKTLKWAMKDSIITYNSIEYLVSSDFYNYLFIEDDSIKEHCFGELLYGITKFAPFALKESDIVFFKDRYPESLFSSMVSVRSVERSTEVQLSPDIKLLDTTGKIFQSISKISNFYKGKNDVVIDLWATWCVPCRLEFKKNPPIDSFLKLYNISKVYISYDFENMKREWFRTISYYSLLGDHILAGEALQTDIKKIFFNGGIVSLPKYIFISKRGVIKNIDLPRPSETGRFMAVLKELLVE